MTRVNKQDETDIGRYIDGEMSATECAGFDVRLQKDEVLRAALGAAEDSTRILREACPEALGAPANFSAVVLDKVRRMPSRDELVQITQTEQDLVSVVTYGRRLLVAAVVICGLGLLFGFDLIQNVDGDGLSANPNDDKKLMNQLDEKVKAMLEERLRQK